MITPTDLARLQAVYCLLELELAEYEYLDADHPLLCAAVDIELFLDDYENGLATYLGLFTCEQNALEVLDV